MCAPQDACAILSGLLVASDYQKGQALVKDNEFKDNAEFFQARLLCMCVCVSMPCVGSV